MDDPSDPTQNNSDSLASAQLEKLKLEIEQLRGQNRGARTARYIPLFSVIITVAGFCFGVYQFRMQQAENEQRFFKNREVEIINERRSKLEKQLNEFYYPISLRLETDKAQWYIILGGGYQYGSEADKLRVFSAERSLVLINQEEMLRIIYSHPDVMQNNPRLKEEVYNFIRYLSAYKGHKSMEVSSHPGEFDSGLVWPAKFDRVINEQMPIVEKHIKECSNIQVKCDDIVWPN